MGRMRGDILITKEKGIIEGDLKRTGEIEMNRGGRGFRREETKLMRGEIEPDNRRMREHNSQYRDERDKERNLQKRGQKEGKQTIL